MSKYEIKPIDTDTFELHYINRDNQSVVIPFKRTVELAIKLQSVDSNARFKMYEYLTSIGKSKKDLTKLIIVSLRLTFCCRSNIK